MININRKKGTKALKGVDIIKLSFEKAKEFVPNSFYDKARKIFDLEKNKKDG